MSFSLNISGHASTDEAAEKINAVLAEKGQELYEAVYAIEKGVGGLSGSCYQQPLGDGQGKSITFSVPDIETE